MYFDIEDYRPDAPRVPSVISVREGVLLSIIVHLAMVIVIILAPSSWFAPAEVVPIVSVPDREPIRYVHIEPLVDRPAPPRLPAVQSDMDRRSATMDRPPDPVTPDPASRGTTSERTVGAPEERAAGPESPVPAARGRTAPPPDPTAVPLPDVTPRLPQMAGGSLGDSLRDLQRYLRDQNFDNQKGGLTEFGPDIQFDSKGIDFGPWIRRFRAQVMSNWNIPQAAMVNSGRVVIQFDLYKNGAISNIRVVTASVVSGFNTAAVNAIRMSNPTLPLPAEYPLDPVLFTVTFHYNEGQPAAS
jgi:TonB family protein